MSTKARIALLSRPFRHQLEHRNHTESRIRCKYIKRPLKPVKNRRLDMLAEQNIMKITPKYEPKDEPSFSISKAVLEATPTARLDHLSRPFVLKLKATRKENIGLGKAYYDIMTEKIAQSLDTIYYHNYKSKMLIAAQQAKRKRSSKSLPERKKIWFEDGDPERLEILATPKPKPKSRPLPKRKWQPLDYLVNRLLTLAVALPRKTFRRPSQDPTMKLLPTKITQEAKEYVATERIKDLCNKWPMRWQVKYVPYRYGVKKGALTAVMTERQEQLAAPKQKANAVSDEKENPYDINPLALKYKPTARIKQLAKPIAR